MTEPVILPAPSVDLTPPPQTKWEREYRAFIRLFPELLSAYRGRYVAIHDEQVIDSDEDEVALAIRALAQVGNVPIHVDLVTEAPPPPVRVPHHREIPRGTA